MIPMYPPPKPPRPPIVDAAVTCPSCHRRHHRDLGCRWCSVQFTHWKDAQRDHPEFSREFCILVGSMVAGLNEAFIWHSNLGRQCTKKELESAAKLAAEYLAKIGYCLE